jgi:hypothetical protein
VKMEKIREFAASERAYMPPKEVRPDDASDIQDLDEIKLHELREVSDRNEFIVVQGNMCEIRFSRCLDSVLQPVRFE